MHLTTKDTTTNKDTCNYATVRNEETSVVKLKNSRSTWGCNGGWQRYGRTTRISNRVRKYALGTCTGTRKRLGSCLQNESMPRTKKTVRKYDVAKKPVRKYAMASAGSTEEWRGSKGEYGIRKMTLHGPLCALCATWKTGPGVLYMYVSASAGGTKMLCWVEYMTLYARAHVLKDRASRPGWN